VAVVGQYIGTDQRTKGQPLATAAKWLITIWMLAVVAATFLWVPAHEGLGNTGRIIMMHVPTAWVSMVAFGVSALFSGLYLWRRRPQYDDRALAATELGFLFSILATVTGSMFAKVAWGSFWNWEPRQTTIIVLLLIYGAYFALRSAIDDGERRKQLAAVYALFAFVTAPLLIFVIPRQFENSLHPNCAFLQGSECNGIVLSEGRVDQLGDQRVQLLDVQRNGDVVTAIVDVSATGGRRSQLEPTLNTATGERTTPNFIDSRFMLALESVEGDQVRLNIQAPGEESQLTNIATTATLIASVLGFTGLFFWVYALRSRLLGVRRRVEAQVNV
jgi:heme exporter protein C